MPRKKHHQPGRECRLYVTGMHCSSCELLIEKKLLKRENVVSVDVSRQNDTVRIVFDRPMPVDLNEMNEEFKELGYSFSHQMNVKIQKRLFYKAEGGWRVNKAKSIKLLKVFSLSVGVLAVFFLVEKMQLGRFVSVNAASSMLAFLLLGLVASVSSCAALVGGLLMSMTKQWHEVYISDDHKRATPHILFHSGRLLSFWLLGGLLGWIGSSISFNNITFFAIVVILVSILMLLLALQMLEVSWARRLSIRLPRFIVRAAADEQRFKGKFMPFVTGMLTFFLPCGFTLIAQGIALTTGNFITSSLIMLLFALGTAPVLCAISFTGLSFTKKPHLTARFSHVAGIIIIFFAFYNINGQLNVLGMKSLSDIAWARTEASFNGPASSSDDPVIIFGPDAGKRLSEVSRTAADTVTDGEQLISLTAQGFEYIATGSTVLQAGVPTKLVVQDNGILGCGSYIAARGLFDGFVALRPGENVIDVGTPKPGSYKITCSMGMVPPVTINFQ